MKERKIEKKRRIGERIKERTNKRKTKKKGDSERGRKDRKNQTKKKKDGQKARKKEIRPNAICRVLRVFSNRWTDRLKDQPTDQLTD